MNVSRNSSKTEALNNKQLVMLYAVSAVKQKKGANSLHCRLHALTVLFDIN